MLRNSDKMVLISSTSNQWIQQGNNNNNNNNQKEMVSIATTIPPRVMDHNNKVTNFSQEQQQQQQQNNSQEPLRCPRCDSSNTKFCYYNNYSLSQPRHFCKACKRYWTRGGTLRNVPVGGGYRKNKRVRRPSNNSSSSTNNTTNNSNLHEGSVNSFPSNNAHHIHDLMTNPLFYGMSSSNNHDHNLMNFPFSRCDLQNPPQINGLGLGFSNGLIHNNSNIINGDFRSNPLLSTYANNNNTPTTISSLFASSFQNKGGANNFHALLPSYEDGLHMKGGMFVKEVKMELEGQNRAIDHHSSQNNNHMDQNMCSSLSNDPSVIWGSGPNLGAWIDPSNNTLGSSFPSMI